MRFYSFCIFILVFISIHFSFSQESDTIKLYIEKLDKGQIEEVKSKLPELVSGYQNNAGVLYLQGRLASDGIEAMKYYQMVIENFPKSEWADDALYRIYQYYYALGLYKTAELKMQHLKKEYPNSPYVTGKVEVVFPVEDEEDTNVNMKNRELLDSLPKGESITLERNTSLFTLQVGAFSTLNNAQKLKEFFEDLNYVAEIVNKVRSGKSLFLVWVGNFNTTDEAKKTALEIQSKYKIKALVIERY